MATSISLPGMGGAGSAGGSASTRPSALMRMMDIPELELSAKERVMAMWRISSKSISVPMACMGVADECHAKLAISDTDHHTHVPKRHPRLKAQVVQELDSYSDEGGVHHQVRSPLLPPGNQPPIPFIYVKFSLTRALTDHIQQTSMLGLWEGDAVEVTHPF